MKNDSLMVPEKDTKHFLSLSKFYEGYSRFIEHQSRYEDWEDAVVRVMNMHRSFYKDKMTDELKEAIDFAEKAYKEKRVLGAQRALQFGGEQILKHNMRMFNCVFTHASRPEFFGEMFYVLLAGAGAGFSVQKHHTELLPVINPRHKQAKIHIIEDSIEGWGTALDVLLSSFFAGGGKHPEYEGRKVYFDHTKIRPKNALISGGFRAPGPEPLRNALNKIENILTSVAEQKRKLNPIEIYDIVMHSSDAVLAGGVRRSATICIFDADDEEMALAKTGDWHVTNPQRGRSNNSAAIIRDVTSREIYDKIFEYNKQFGEPGFVFLPHKDVGLNPCAEIGMYPILDGETGFQGCNLTEINGSSCSTLEDFLINCRAAAILGTLQAGYTDFKFMSSVTKKIFDREALLGVSITGWMNNPDILFNAENMKRGAKLVKKTNKEIAELIGINPAARTTCTKPSGNASTLLMTASGIHGEHSKRYFRNAQMNKDTDVAKLLIETNPNMIEESVWSTNRTDVVISYPCVAKEGSIFKKDLYGVNLLKYVKLVQENWVEEGTDEDLCVIPGMRHNVSNTIQVDDWDEVKEFIWSNNDVFAGVSLLPLSGDKDYAQAPFTEVLTFDEISNKYGIAALFASGLVVDGLHAFNNDLWLACSTALGYGEKITEETHHHALKKDWVRRFHNFSSNYFEKNIKKTEYCLKDIYLLHKWTKIQQNLKEVDWKSHLTKEKLIDIDTMGAQACAGNGCEI